MDFPEHLQVESHTIKIVPRYCETDQGGVVHHSVFPVYLEMGRTELLRANGLAYKKLEEAGVFFVVAELFIKYRQPARYDEELSLETICSSVSAARIEHKYVLKRVADNVIILEARTILACIDSDGKLSRIPKFMYPE